jgi:AraC-like DNA-binding protein
VVIYSRFPSQAEIDAAYAVRIFLQHHPGRAVSLSTLIRDSGVSAQRLKAAFRHQFGEELEEYSERMR